jgi:ERCC4-related helicase
MAPSALEDVMTAFDERACDLLLWTNIIESGLDIPSANTLIVHRADMFGLAQLHQLRGRIGRSKGSCLCLSDPAGKEEARADREAAARNYADAGLLNRYQAHTGSHAQGFDPGQNRPDAVQELKVRRLFAGGRWTR